MMKQRMPLGAWYDILTREPQRVAYKYWKGKIISTSPPPDTSEGGSAPAVGYYMEKGPWVYRWNTTTKDITLVLSPTSATPKQVAAGSKAYDAILQVITTGKAQKVSAAEVKRLRAAARVAPRLEKITTDLQVGPAVAQAAEQAGGTGTFLDTIPTWWFWVLGGGVVATVAGILLIPRQSAQPRGSVYPTTATVAGKA